MQMVQDLMPWRKGEEWNKMVETVNGSRIGDRSSVGDYFAIPWKMNVTFKGAPGPTRWTKFVVYEVKDGKIVKRTIFLQSIIKFGEPCYNQSIGFLSIPNLCNALMCEHNAWPKVCAQRYGIPCSSAVCFTMAEVRGNVRGWCWETRWYSIWKFNPPMYQDSHLLLRQNRMSY